MVFGTTDVSACAYVAVPGDTGTNFGTPTAIRVKSSTFTNAGVVVQTWALDNQAGVNAADDSFHLAVYC